MDNLTEIPGIGAKTLQKLNKLGISTPRDLLFHFPHRYIDFSRVVLIKDIEPYTAVTVKGEIIFFQNIYTRSGKNLQKAIIRDQSSTLELIWFNQPYLANTFKVGETFSFAGTVETFKNKLTLIAPEYGDYHTGKIIAVYPETQGLTSKWFRKTIQSNINSLTGNIDEYLPPQLLDRYSLYDLKRALIEIHTPSSPGTLESARHRLSVDEILCHQARSYLLKKEWQSLTPQYNFQITNSSQKKLDKLIASLPFTLTSSQTEVWNDIRDDLLKNTPMNRLLQGDVGSGKTVVALLAAYIASLNNSVTVFIAPTEILAVQHYETFKTLLASQKITLHLVTSSSKLKPKSVKSGDIIIGTHAAIFHQKHFSDLVGLLIIDEQHKFGVSQRNFLNDSSKVVHTLTMTATPIPRTISLTLLGNLDLSVISTLPKNRLPIKTFLVPDHKKSDCYQWIEAEITKTHCQSFIVCPLIEESETLLTVKSAKKEFEHLSQNVFPHLKLALIHGKMKPKEKQEVIKDFQDNKVNILVTTPIIEVGVDIPNSSIILIQSADRFGLAQLHQLRGRVGRGHLQSYCYLFTESTNEKAGNRLQYLASHNNGMEIAEYDLKTRGGGSAFSTAQHGFFSLKIADMSNLETIQASQKILADLISDYPEFDLQSLLSDELPVSTFRS